MQTDLRIVKSIVSAYKINQSITLSSGIQSDCYYDIKSLLLDNISWNQIKIPVWQDLKSKFPEATNVAGSGIGGAILAMRLAEFNLNPIIIRENPKEHGLLRQIEGKYFCTGTARTVIVDDVCTTGKSFIKTKKILHEYGLKTLGNFVLLKRKESNFRCESFISLW